MNSNFRSHKSNTSLLYSNFQSLIGVISFKYALVIPLLSEIQNAARKIVRRGTGVVRKEDIVSSDEEDGEGGQSPTSHSK